MSMLYVKPIGFIEVSTKKPKIPRFNRFMLKNVRAGWKYFPSMKKVLLILKVFRI